jgi:hypothetical protein
VTSSKASDTKERETMTTATIARTSGKTGKKEVQPLYRVQSKRDPRKVIYIVRSSDGSTEYTVSFFCGKVTSCSCPSRKPCYHQAQIQRREDERQAAEIAAEQAAEMAEYEAWKKANVPDRLSRQAFVQEFGLEDFCNGVY